MKIHKLKDMIRGWLIGNFEPTVFKTKDVEVGVRHYLSGEYEKRHFHKVATEITVIVSGEVVMNDRVFGPGDIVTILPNESTDFKAIRNTVNVVIKIPGELNDKYEV